jgi:drug/metabolite transporter (DMT)-like permease
MDATRAGDVLALASAASFACANVLIARGSRPEGGDNGAFTSLLITAAIAGAGWIIQGVARGFEPVTWRALAWFAGGGVFTGFIGRVL